MMTKGDFEHKSFFANSILSNAVCSTNVKLHKFLSSCCFYFFEDVVKI